MDLRLTSWRPLKVALSQKVENAFTGLIYFQVLQIGSRSIINQLIKPGNAEKSAFSFFKSQDSFSRKENPPLPKDVF